MTTDGWWERVPRRSIRFVTTASRDLGFGCGLCGQVSHLRETEETTLRACRGTQSARWVVNSASAATVTFRMENGMPVARFRRCLPQGHSRICHMFSAREEFRRDIRDDPARLEDSFSAVPKLRSRRGTPPTPASTGPRHVGSGTRARLALAVELQQFAGGTQR